MPYVCPPYTRPLSYTHEGLSKTHRDRQFELKLDGIRKVIEIAVHIRYGFNFRVSFIWKQDGPRNARRQDIKSRGPDGPPTYLHRYLLPSLPVVENIY